MIVTCPMCKSRHHQVGSTNYCQDCGVPPVEVMQALMLPFQGGPWESFDYDEEDPFPEMSHDDYVGWDIGAQ